MEFSKKIESINGVEILSIGKSLELIIFGISFIVSRFAVISSPSLPSPLDKPFLNSPFL